MSNRPFVAIRALAAAFALAALPATAALAAPRVAVVVTSHAGLGDDQSDELAYDLAAAIAARIDGEAIAGASVRDKAGAIEPGCESDLACARKVGATVGTDEVLFVAVKRSAKKDVSVTARRVARDPERVPVDGNAVLLPARAKRARAIQELVASLYVPGSVVPYVEPPSSPPPEPVVAAPEEPAPPATRAPSLRTKAKDTGGGRPVWKKGWFWGVLAGSVVVVAGATVGIVFAAQPGPTAPSVQLPP